MTVHEYDLNDAWNCPWCGGPMEGAHEECEIAVYEQHEIDVAKFGALQAERDDLAREVGRLREAIQTADEVVTMEINPSNYSHDDVCLLNDQMIEAFGVLTDALKGDDDERA